MLKSEFPKDSSKQLLQFISGECEKLQTAKRELQYKIQLVNKELNVFPDYKPILIKRNAKKYYNLLKDRRFATLQATYRELVSSIKVDNENVKIELNLNVLLGSYLPITVTVIEKRDYIARPENLSLQSLAFSALSVDIA